MDESRIDRIADKTFQDIADTSAPKRMSITEARYYYESLISHLQSVISGLGCDEHETETD